MWEAADLLEFPMGSFQDWRVKIIQQTREDLRSTHDKLKQWPSRLKAKKTEAATTKFRGQHKAVVAVVAVVGSPAGSAYERSRASTLNVYDAADAGGSFLCHSHVTFLTEIAFLFFFECQK